jgi:putative aldouronate transport system substrate-binding protein
MRKIKIFMCGFLAMLFTFSVSLTGCTPTTNVKNSSTAGTSSVAAPAVTLKMFTVGTSQKDTQRITDAVDKYLQSKNINIKLDWQILGYGSDTYGDKINNILATGQDADIVFTCNWIADYKTNAQHNYYLDLSSYLSDAKNKDLVDLIGKDFLDASKINGKNYALPTNKEKAHDWGIIAQTSMLTKYGIDPTKVKSLADLEPYFDKIKADGITPLVTVNMDSPYHMLDWDVIVGDNTPGALYPDNRDSKIIDQFTAPESVALYKQMKTYRAKGWIAADASTQKDEETSMKTGKYFCGIWSLKPGKDKEESQSLGIGLTQMTVTSPIMSNRETTGAMLAVPVASKHQAEALQFIKLLYTDKTLINLMNFGEEKTDYTKVSDNVIKINTNATFQLASGWIFGNQFNNFLLQTESPTKWDDFVAFNTSATKEKSLGFMFDTTPVKSQVAVLQPTVDKHYKALLNGAVSNVDTEVAAFSKELKADGVDAVITEMQKQYDAFLAAK